MYVYIVYICNRFYSVYLLRVISLPMNIIIISFMFNVLVKESYYDAR